MAEEFDEFVRREKHAAPLSDPAQKTAHAGGDPVATGKYVCNHCVYDDALSALILEEGQERTCDYCEISRKDAKTRSLSIRELADQVLERILWEYSDVDSEMVSYDSEEGEYFCETYTTHGLLSDQIGLEAHEGVVHDIASELPDLTWCKKRLRPADLAAALETGWEVFADLVKHHTRYFFSEAEKKQDDPESFPQPEAFGVTYDPDEGIPPERILDAIGLIILRAKLIRTLVTGTTFFRARVHKSHEQPSTASELGPPSKERASNSNRMSPAGIVMFYGALDPETAIRETFQAERKGASERVVSVAQFKTRKLLRVLDLTDLPPVPSFFGDFELHHGIRFLHGFERDFVKAVARDGMEHVEYVPTQIVAEYLRYRFPADESGGKLDGIIYNSSRNQKPACVLFFESSDCGGDASFPKKEPILELVESATDRIQGAELIQRFGKHSAS